MDVKTIDNLCKCIPDLLRYDGLASQHWTSKTQASPGNGSRKKNYILSGHVRYGGEGQTLVRQVFLMGEKCLELFWTDICIHEGKTYIFAHALLFKA